MARPLRRPLRGSVMELTGKNCRSIFSLFGYLVRFQDIKAFDKNVDPFDKNRLVSSILTVPAKDRFLPNKGLLSHEPDLGKEKVPGAAKLIGRVGSRGFKTENLSEKRGPTDPWVA